MARYFLRISLKNKSHKFFHGTTFLHPFRSHGPGAEKIAWDHNKDEKSKAREGEDPDEGAAPAGVFPDIDSVVDNRCQGADQGAQPGAVHAVQQGGQIFRKGIQHNGRRDIGDDLAQQDAPPVFPSANRPLQEHGDGRVGGNGGRENEKAEKRDEEHIVCFQECPPVEEENGQKYRCGNICPQTGAADDGEEDQHEEGDIQYPVFLPLREPASPGFVHVKADGFPGLPAEQSQHKQRQQQPGQQPQGQHMHKKGSRADTGTPEKKQVLGTAEGGQHGAANGGDVFHGDHRKDIFFLSPGPEQQNGQRDEDDEGNVVGDKHGGKEHRKHQKQGKPRHGADPAGKPDQGQKNILLFEAFQHREHHEEHGEGMPVDLGQKRGAGGRNQQRNQRRQQRNREHQIFFEQFRYFFHISYLSENTFGSIAPFSTKGKKMFPFGSACREAR